MPVRKAKAIWEGGLKGGNGRFEGQTGLAGQYNFSSRFENGTGSNPEELLAAAHAACYSMALSSGLEKAGHAPRTVETHAECTIEKVEAGFRVTGMKLIARAAVEGIADAEFQKIAAATKDGCPISNALKAIPKIELDAKLV
jgi:osmotically inducible protein OsmC